METGQQQHAPNSDGPSTSRIGRTILLAMFLFVVPCLWYYYLVRFVVPDNPAMELNAMVVEKSGMFDNVVSKWHMNLTLKNPDKRWQGNFRDVRFNLIMRDDSQQKGQVLSNKTVEPFSLGRNQGLKITLNMDVADELEEDQWDEEMFAIRVYLKASYEDKHNSFIKDYWEVRLECSDLRFKVRRGKGELINKVPTKCEDRVRIIPHRHMFSI